MDLTQTLLIVGLVALPLVGILLWGRQRGRRRRR